MSVPTTVQAQAALRKANEVRLLRAGLKQTLAAFPTRPEAVEEAARLIEDTTPEWLRTMKVFDLVLACRRVGPHYTRRLFNEAAIGRDRKVGNLTARERGVLVGLLRRPPEEGRSDPTDRYFKLIPGGNR
jgi:hypothetical protein